MRRINLSQYSVFGKDENGQDIKAPYDVRGSTIEILFDRALNLSAQELLKRDDLARKILNCPNDYILLEDEEYNKLLQSIEIVMGFSKPDIEFVRRIIEAPKIEVQEKQKEEK